MFFNDCEMEKSFLFNVPETYKIREASFETKWCFVHTNEVTDPDDTRELLNQNDTL